MEADDGLPESSSVWLSVKSGALQFNEEPLRRRHGNRVTVLGTLLGPDEKLGGGAFVSVSRRGIGKVHRAALSLPFYDVRLRCAHELQ